MITHHHLASGLITQVSNITGEQAIALGLWDRPPHPELENVVHLYFFDAIFGGAIWGEEAKFSVLKSFEEHANYTCEEIWCDYKREVSDYLIHHKHA